MQQASPLQTDGNLVPSYLLVPPFADERRGLLRDAAAFLLDRHLRRLARMRNPVELRLARLLRRFQDLSGYLDLGFARLADYATERLGIALRRMQVLIQMARRLEALPATAAAFESGRISESHVRLLLRVAMPATEAAWLERAARLNVRLLEREVRRARAAGGGGPAGDEVDRADDGGSSGQSAPAAAGSATPPRPDASDPAAGEDEAPGREVSFPAPGALRARWEWAIETSRRAAGSADPVWRTAEHIVADYLSGVRDLAAFIGGAIGEERAAALEDPPACARGSGGESAAGDGDDDPGVDLFEEVIRGLEEEYGATDDWTEDSEGSASSSTPGGVPDAGPRVGTDAGPPAGPDGTPGDDCVAGAGSALDPGISDDDPRRLDDRLRALVRLRQNLAWHQGRLLCTFTRLGLHRDLGFYSFGRYCRERLGLGLRRARSLIALERRLLELPALARAYRDGTLSWVRASEVARVADEVNENDWIHLARSITVRRLREEVTVAAAEIEGDGSYRPAPPGRRRGDPPGIDASGRIDLRSPGRRARQEVQTCALRTPADASPDGGAVQTLTRPMSPDAAPLSTDTPPNAGAVQTSTPPAEGDAERRVRIRFWAPTDVADLWQHALRVCRLVEGGPLEDWECVERMIDSFRRSFDLRADPKWLRRYRVFERDGWRCRAPGCSSRRNLQEHHVVYRSEGGDDSDDNLVALCATHHLQGIHAGRLRCHRLPDGLLAWDLGLGPDGRAFERYVEEVAWDEARRSVAGGPEVVAPAGGMPLTAPAAGADAAARAKPPAAAAALDAPVDLAAAVPDADAAAVA